MVQLRTMTLRITVASLPQVTVHTEATSNLDDPAFITCIDRAIEGVNPGSPTGAGANENDLKPDLLIDSGKQRWILDTKWKRVDARKPQKNYDLSQSDFYQLFAYGHKYRRGDEVPKLVLIFPYWSGLKEALPVFDYGDSMNLWVLPFDLDANHLIGAEKATLPLSFASFASAGGTFSNT